MVEHIGRYQIIEEIGQGAMATVYKAHDPKIDRTLAIKLLRPERCIDEEYRMRFLREARAVGVLSHPNIVTIYDVGEVENVPYIAMELLTGTPLDEVMNATAAHPIEKVLKYGVQIAQALDYAHSKGIVHRDIKPSNIILLEDAETVKITDFGIAHVETLDVTQHTQMGEVLGTPQYMSPEQVIGKNVDGRSDLFSLGVILYQMITNQKPFKAETLATLLFQIATENPQPVGDLAPDLPGALKQIIDKLLKKQPEKRFATGRDVAHALQRVLGDIEELALDTGERIIPIQVKWSAIMAAVVSLTMIICGSYMYSQQKQTMTDQVLTFGSSLAKFIAVETAESVLSEDWPSIELFVQDTIARQDFNYLIIVDHDGVIRGSNNPEILQSQYNKPTDSEPVSQLNTVIVSRHVFTDNEEVLDFDTPILFQNTEIGRVHLGLPIAPLERVANQIVVLLTILLITTIIAVVVVVYILGKLTATPLATLLKGINEISHGHFSYRIAVERKDEFGQVFNKFDNMAEALQKQDETRALEQSELNQENKQRHSA